MNSEYLQEVFRLFEEAGFNPEWCDVPVPLLENTVQAGWPTEVGDVFCDEYTMVPRSLARCGVIVSLPVRGDSMVDCDIQEGDVLSVQITEGCSGIREGDVVVAEVDGGITVKVFFRDEKGDVWLLPRNEKYMPIHLTEEMNARIVGKVVEYKRVAPHTSVGEMLKIMKRGVRKEVTPPSERAVKGVIVRIAERVKNRRQWYAVYRALVDKGAPQAADYPAFVEFVERIVPEHPHLPTTDQLQRMCTMSFSKCLALWNRNNAPVQGTRYDEYYAIAMEVMRML